MSRISENQIIQPLLNDIANNRQTMDKLSAEVSTGIKVPNPGDSLYSGTISQLTNLTQRVEGFQDRIEMVRSYVSFQNDVVSQVGDLIIRAQEIATQASNETNSPESRYALAEEVFQMRDHLVQLGNSQYQGKYVFNGTNDNVTPFQKETDYVTGVPPNGSGEEWERWTYDLGTLDGSTGSNAIKTVRITDNLEMDVNITGDNVFEHTVFVLERLGRSLKGFDTDTPTAITGFNTGIPDGNGAAYNFNTTGFTDQTQDIQQCLDDLKTARTMEVLPTQVMMAGKMKRLETAESLLELSNMSTTEVLSNLQDADIIESATNLSLAETALQASMTVTSRLLNLSILNYL